MIALARREFKRGSNVAIFKQRLVLKYLLTRRSGSQKIENIPHPNAHAAKDRTSRAYLWIDRYPVKLIHRSQLRPATPR
jgi:hypothetical protein